LDEETDESYKEECEGDRVRKEEEETETRMESFKKTETQNFNGL
jgi:hypothetical protein